MCVCVCVCVCVVLGRYSEAEAVKGESLYSMQRVWTPESRKSLRRLASRRLSIDESSAKNVKRYWEEKRSELSSRERSPLRHGSSPGNKAAASPDPAAGVKHVETNYSGSRCDESLGSEYGSGG